jgi:ribosome-interacting GTPase 1
VTDYPFATQFPIPGMLEHHGAAIQLVDTPAIVPGISNGEGVGRKLLHLFSVADALGIVVDLSQDPIEQITGIFTELSATPVLTISHPISTVLRVKSKGGIKFSGRSIAKEEQRAAQQILASAGISHAEIRVREQFSAEELSAQVEHKHPLPSIIITNKNDVPDARSKCEALRKSFADYTIIDVNFLDETHFDTLKDEIFSILGLIQLFLLDRSSRDSKRTLRIVPKASTISEVVERLSLPHAERLKAANIWGKSVKYDGQEVGIDHLIEDGDMIYLQV